MPISISAKKSLRKSIKNSEINKQVKKKLKAAIKQYLAKPTKELLDKTISLIDKTAKSGVYHKNKATRVKSRLSKKLRTVETKKAVAKKETTKKTAKM